MIDNYSESDRLMDGVLSSFDERSVGEKSLRPKSFDDFIGQKSVVKNLEIMLHSAKKRSAPVDHVLLAGPPGLGKTTLAGIVAGQMNSNMHTASGPLLDKKGDLAAILSSLEPNDVLFIDEIHRVPISVEETLYSAMEDFRLDIIVGQGAGARTMSIDLAPFSVVGATTRVGLLSGPLRDRFGGILSFDFYSADDLTIILERNARLMGVEIEFTVIQEMAKRSRGTPRIANRILRRIRDLSLYLEADSIDQTVLQECLKLMKIDTYGLDQFDRKILTTIETSYGGGPVGIEALSATLAEDRRTLEEVYEPYLLKEGFLKRTPRGRVLSEKGSDHLAQMQSLAGEF